MEITNHNVTSQIQGDKLATLKEGEVYRATVKERLAKNEAILQIKGREVHVKFDDNIPVTNRVTIQITNVEEDRLRARTLAEEPKGAELFVREGKALNDVLRNLGAGATSTSVLRQAAQRLLDKSIPLTKEAVKELQQFFSSAKGTTAQKIETIQAMASKRLEINATQLSSVHEALHGRPFAQTISELARTLDPNLKVEREQARLANMQVNKQLGDAANTYLLKALGKITATNENIDSSKLQETGEHLSSQRASDVIKQSEQLLQREANFPRAIEQIGEQLINKLPLEQAIVDKIEKQLAKSKAVYEQGREIAARGKIMEMLADLEQQAIASKEAVQNQEQQVTRPFLLDEAFQQAVHLQSKDIAVTTITEKLAKAAVEFKQLQREMTRNLDAANRLIEQFRGQASTQVKPLLETTIKKLDNAILKSEMMLFANMKTEKQLLQASAQLGEASKLLAKGNYFATKQIVEKVKALLEKINYRPSETKVMHYVSEARLETESKPPRQHVLQQVNEASSRFLQIQEPSARQAFEMVRSLGLNRDSEIGQFLTGSQREHENNLKAALLQLLRSEEEGSRVGQLANQALNNITGQQLLSKADTAGNLQNMFFNLPFLLEEKIENLQVFVNSRNEGQQVDWENCQLYFLIETPKLGEIGIMVTVVDRHLSVTLKNDEPTFKERMEPLVQQRSENIAEIGYTINGIKFAKMTVSAENETIKVEKEEKATERPIYTEKGFDYKI